jgi:Ca2+-binding EF-hand superfamily protein
MKNGKQNMMNAIIIKAATVAISLFLLSGTGWALHPIFEKADTNKDGKVVREELERYMKEDAYEKLDTDKDNVISGAEWNKADDVLEIKEYKETFKVIDKNKNWKISYPEFSNYLDKYSNIDDAFMILDKNGDNILASEEIDYVPSFRLITIHFK